MSFAKIGAVGLSIVGAVGLVAACSSTVRNNSFDEIDSAVDPGLGDSGGNDGPTFLDPDAATNGVCPEGSETKITGKVFDPAGKNPLYNIQVYVPSGELPEIKVGLPPPKPDGFCAGSTCDSEVLNPVVAALTNTKGEFELKGPRLFPGKDVPLVMQIGKWRRKIVIPEVKACQDNKLPVSGTRLPKNGSEGDMPHIALSTGCDALECLLYGIGIDASEFEAGDTKTGKHIHMFSGAGFSTPTTVNGRTMPTAADNLWNDATRMYGFDVAMLSCECNEYAPGAPSGGGTPNKPVGLGTMRNYANLGGRVFGTHFHFSWMKYNPGWQNGILDFSGSGTSASTLPINTSFPKGQALADWLVEVGASTTPGQLAIDSSLTRESHRGAVAGSPAQEWIGKGETARYISFNTPVGIPATEQCGRFVFSDIHSTSTAAANFPSSCAALNKAQLPLEFMFFDLNSCVQDETKPPVVPK